MSVDPNPAHSDSSTRSTHPEIVFSIPDINVTPEPSSLLGPHHQSHTSNLPLLDTTAFGHSLVSLFGTTLEPDSATSTSSDSHSSPRNDLPTRTDSKPRRKRPKVDLAPDQPLTTQGKARTRVYSACLQCRSRKTRCDGRKPACHNCSRRPSDDPCTYDVAPNRRGPDREPGARQRIKEGQREPRRRRRRLSESKIPLPPVKEEHKSASTVLQSSVFTPSIAQGAPQPTLKPDSPAILSDQPFLLDIPTALNVSDPTIDLTQVLNAPLYSQELIPSEKPELFDSFVFSAPRTFVQEDDEEEDYEPWSAVVSGPSLHFSRQTWWDALLSSYLLPDHSRNFHALASSEREIACQQIVNDMRFLFRSANYWFCFFNVPRFFAVFSDPEKRTMMQPSLILAALAISTFLQSSEVELGAKGRKKAMQLRDQAQGALEASYNAGWLDESLVQAAWLIAFFEVCSHPHHASQRVVSAIVILDSLIRGLSLTTLDVSDLRTTTFTRGTPAVVSSQESSKLDINTLDAPNSECQCAKHSLGSTWHLARVITPLWISTPAWPEDLPESEMRKEECRRLVWSSMMLVAGHTSYIAAHQQPFAADLALAEPSNYALLFPGESLASSSSQGKDSVWSLYVRSMMLWNSCLRIRRDSTVSDSDKSQFAMTAWLESYKLDEAMSKHTCDLERSYMFLGREYLFNTRMCISYEFQRFSPNVTAMNMNFNRRKAEEWLTHQATVIKHLMYGLHKVTGQAGGSIVHRPFFVFWFMGQISRALTLWACDNTLTIALEVSKALMAHVEYLMSLWPCNTLRERNCRLLERLESACTIAGVPSYSQSKISLRQLSS